MENLEVHSIGEALSVGGMVSLQGMTVVFAVLLILMFVLMLMKVFFYKGPSKQKKKEASPVVQEKVSAEISADDEELIAVLTAAIAASLNTSTYNLKIKSYRRVGNNAPAWNKAGLDETVNHY